MRITKISVKGLFGMFDHEIPLNQESRITIIHGPNGVGKTVILSMLDGLFNLDFVLFSAIRFENFRVEYDSGEAITVRKQMDTDSISLCYSDCTHSHVAEFVPELQKLRSRFQLSNRRFWEQKDTWNHNVMVNKIVRDGVHEAIPVLRDWTTKGIPDWFMRISSQYHVSLVHTQRRVETPKSLPVFTVLLIPSILSLFVLVHVMASYWSLLSTFTRIVVLSILLPFLAVVVFVVFVYLYMTFSARFRDYALGVPAIVTSVSESLAARRLTGETDAQERLFASIINSRFRCNSFELDQEEGFILYGHDGRRISESLLASGEKQLLYLYYHLIFIAERDMLVMIDEPELSLHVRWQRKFLKDLQRIIALRNFDVLIATHSPQIVFDKWKWLVDLKQTNGHG